MKRKPVKKWKRVVRRIIVILILLAMLGCAGFVGYKQLQSEYQITYDSYTASVGSISNSLSFSGSFQLVNSEYIVAPSSCKIRTLYVAAGDTVAQGDKLARLSTGETLTASFDGRVNTLSYAEGDEIASNTTIMQVVDFTHLKVTMRVDEYDISSVSVGTKCTVTATATEQSYESTVASIDYVSASSGSVAYYTATAYVDVGEGIYPGMQVTISIPQEEANDVVVLKVDALSFDATNQAYVYIMNDSGEMEQTNVEVGVSNGNYCEIISGVSDGDTVYVEAATEETASGVSSLLSGLFNQGGPTVNGGGSFDRSSMGGRSFDSSNMPDMSNFPGNSSSGGSSSGGSSGGSMPSGGSAPSMGGGN